MKLCNTCGTIKPLSDFVKDQQRKDGLSYYCKSCVRQRQTKWRTGNRERVRQLERKSWLKKTWGMTVEEYEAKSQAQNNCCAICQLPETEGRRLAVDHCHKTGKIRGLLCRKCNTSLAQFENTNSLERALEYLR